MKERLIRVAKLLAYPAFYLLALVFFGYLAFPYSRLKDRVIAELERRSKTAQRVEIDHISSYWFSGIEASGVRVILAKAEDTSPFKSPSADDGAGDKSKETVINIDEAHVRLKLLPLLIGRMRVSFWVSGLGGEIKGSVPMPGANGPIEIELDKVDIGKIEPLTAAIGGIPLHGAASGKIDLSPEEGRLSKASGTIELTIADVVVSDGKTKIQGLIELPAAKLGDLTFSAEAKDGVLKVNKLAATGTDIELLGDGKVGLHDNWHNSVADVFVRFKFTDAYRGKNEMTKTLLGAPGSTSPSLIDTQVSKLKRAKRSDGFYGFHAHGLLKRLQFDPSPEGGAGAATAGTGGAHRPSRGDSPFNSGRKGMFPSPAVAPADDDAAKPAAPSMPSPAPMPEALKPPAANEAPAREREPGAAPGNAQPEPPTPEPAQPAQPAPDQPEAPEAPAE